MRAGRLRHRLAIQRASESASPTGNGERVKTWTTRATVWGGVEPLSAKELFTAGQVSARATHKVTIRGGGMQAGERIKFGDRIFHIESPLDREERGIESTLLATEVIA